MLRWDFEMCYKRENFMQTSEYSILSLEWAFPEKELKGSNLRVSSCHEIGICHRNLIVISQQWSDDVIVESLRDFVGCCVSRHIKYACVLYVCGYALFKKNLCFLFF